MRDAPFLGRVPLVLAASVSATDRRSLEKLLIDARFEAQGIDGARDADGAISRHGGPWVLVIDAGLLGMTHDGQWRLLRERHPTLGVVVRCLVDRNLGPQRMDGHTFLVHPDHDEGLVKAVRALADAAAECLVGSENSFAQGQHSLGGGHQARSAGDASAPPPRASAGRGVEAARRTDRIPSRRHGS
jgi:hypothetical protein